MKFRILNNISKKENIGITPIGIPIIAIVDSDCNPQLANQYIDYIDKSDYVLDLHEGWGFNRINSSSLGSGIYPQKNLKCRKIGENMLKNVNTSIKFSKD